MARRWMVAGGTTTAGLLCFAATLVPLRGSPTPTAFPEPLPDIEITYRSHDEARAFRHAALAAADVWTPVDPASVDLARNPADPSGQLSTPIVPCRFLPKPAGGTTPKFRCVLADGEVIKVKYGHTGEVPAELASTRLLTALGFGADQMYAVPVVRCYGCPVFPFHAMWTLDWFKARDLVADRLPDSRYTDFAWPAVERHWPGVEIAHGGDEGWAWYELAAVTNPSGASRAEVDALRLIAVFLAHWDNKAANQRLVCQSPESDASHPCRESFAIIQDLGATFGPNKVDLDSWERAPIWADRTNCRVSMRDFPYQGGTFEDVSISEAGRALLVRQLEALGPAQIESLFRGARFPEFHGSGRGADVREWTRVFTAKVRDLSAAAPCPA